MSEAYVIECLIFVVYPEEIPHPEYQSSSTSPRIDINSAYVLLPEIAVEFRDPILDFFAWNGLEVIWSREEFPDVLSSSVCKVEIIHIHLRSSRAANFFSVCSDIVLTRERKILSVLFTRFVNRSFSSLNSGYFYHPPECQSSVFEDTASMETIFNHLVKFDPNISYKGEKGTILLHLAISRECEALARYLLVNGADTEARNEWHATALHLAVGYYRSDSITKLLIEHGADVNSTTVYAGHPGMTPLHICLSAKSSVTAIKLLLDNGANIDAHDDSGRSVLELATLEFPDSLPCVLSHRPKVDDDHNKSVLRKLLTPEEPKYSGDFPAINACIDQLLAYGFDIDQEAAMDKKILFTAIEFGHVEMVTRLLRLGSSPTELFRGNTPLHDAATWSSDSIAQVLLDFGADINAKTAEGETALRVATKFGNIEVLKCLLARGAKLTDHQFLLHTAVSGIYFCEGHSKNVETVKFLIEHGADIHASDNEGNTPITLASKRYAFKGDIMDILICHGARLDVKNESILADFYETIPFPHLDALSVYIGNGIDAESNISEVMNRVIKIPTNIEFFLVFYDLYPDIYKDIFFFPEKCRIHVYYKEMIRKNILEYGLMSFERIFESQYMKNLIFPENTSHPVSTLFSSRDFWKHIAALFYANLTINNNFNLQNSELVSIIPSLFGDEWPETCKSELTEMKTHKIGGTDISYYDILDANLPQIVLFLRNENVAETLKSEDYDNFPIYGSLISKRVHKARFRRMMLDKGLEIFNFLFNLPFAVEERIVSYLSNQQLLVLSYVCRSPSTEPSFDFSDFCSTI